MAICVLLLTPKVYHETDTPSAVSLQTVEYISALFVQERLMRTCQ